MLDIRPMTDNELSGVLDVLRAAFTTDSEARLVAALRADAGYVPALSLVAVEDGRIVGHVLFTRARIRSAGDVVGELDAKTAGLLCLAPLAVLPERQGAGIGGALIRKGLERATALGERMVLVLGHPGYYPRFGFVPAGPRGVCAPVEVTEEAWMLCELVPGAAREYVGTAVLAAPFDDPEYW